MCGRATLTTPGDELREQLGLLVVPTLVPRFNIAPSQPIALIRTPGVLSFGAFGLTSVPGRPGRTINLRGESLPNVPSYRDSFQHRRCLVVVDGFFEWRPQDSSAAAQRDLFAGAEDKATRRKAKPKTQAFHVRRSDRKAFTLAAVWSPLPGAAPDNGQEVECAIITGVAAGVVARLHDRMPVIVAPSAREVWLSSPEAAPGATSTRAAKALLEKETVSLGAVDLVAIPVGARVGNPAFDDEEVLRPVRGSEPI